LSLITNCVPWWAVAGLWSCFQCFIFQRILSVGICKEYTNFGQPQHLILLLQRHVSTRSSHHQAIFELCFRCTINSAHFWIPKVYMVLDCCCHVYPTVDKSLLWLKSIQIILKSQFYKLNVIKIRSVSCLWVIWHIIYCKIF